MEGKKVRRKIIDNTSVQRCRRIDVLSKKTKDDDGGVIQLSDNNQCSLKDNIDEPSVNMDVNIQNSVNNYHSVVPENKEALTEENIALVEPELKLSNNAVHIPPNNTSLGEPSLSIIKCETEINSKKETVEDGLPITKKCLAKGYSDLATKHFFTSTITMKSIQKNDENIFLDTNNYCCKENKLYALRRSNLQCLHHEKDSDFGTLKTQINPIYCESEISENCESVSNLFDDSNKDIVNESISRPCEIRCSNSLRGLETKDPFSIELEKTKTNDNDIAIDKISNLFADIYNEYRCDKDETSLLFDSRSMEVDLGGNVNNDSDMEVYSNMTEGSGGPPRLLSMEEKWQVIFNEKTRAPIYAVAQYVDYLHQFVSGQSTASRDTRDVIKKDGINPISYLLRKLKLDLKMSYDSFIDEFLKPGNNGMNLLIKLLKSIQDIGSQQSGSTNRSQLKNYKKTLTDEHDCLLCIKFALRTNTALPTLMAITYGLETVAMSLLSTFTKSRGTAIEILTVSLSAKDGFSRALDCFTVLRLKIGEPVRFKSLMNMMNLDSQQNVIFKVSCMKFLNCLLDGATNLNMRVYVQHELESAGLDINNLLEKTIGTGLEYDDLRHELADWNRKYINVDTILSQKGHVVNTSDDSHRYMIENLQKQVQALSTEKSNLERQLKAVSTELQSKYAELQRRTPPTHTASTQCESTRTRTREVGCQCIDVSDTVNVEWDNPLDNAAQFFGWKETKSHPNEEDAIRYFDYQIGNGQNEPVTSDDEGVEKVHHWLHSHCGSSESDLDILPNCMTDKDFIPYNDDFMKYPQRKKSIRLKSQRMNFPGNWKLIPKSIEQFPARFQSQQCHQTNCDRCDIRNRPENNYSRQAIVQHVQLEFRPNIEKIDKKRPDAKSQSSDSAIGGSGERLWSSKNRRLPLLPPEVSEAEMLQEMIQPDDSASGCPVSEPFPDYSSICSKYDTQKSYRTELSNVLREFEGNLKTYGTADRQTSKDYEEYVTIGDI